MGLQRREELIPTSSFITSDPSIDNNIIYLKLGSKPRGHVGWDSSAL